RLSTAWPSTPTASGSPRRAGTARPASGTRPRAGSWRPSPTPWARSSPRWRSIRTGAGWRRAGASRSGCGTSPAARGWSAGDRAGGGELARGEVPSGGWRDRRIAFTRQGDRFATGCAGQEIRLWDVATRREVATLRGHIDEVRDVAFSPDGRWLASVADAND